jgi:hypothetical protein
MSSVAPPSVPGLVLARLSSAGSRFTARLDGRGERVVLSGLCNGVGSLTVRLSDGTVLPVECVTGEPVLASRRTRGPLHAFTCTITAIGGPTWAVTVGTVP